MVSSWQILFKDFGRFMLIARIFQVRHVWVVFLQPLDALYCAGLPTGPMRRCVRKHQLAFEKDCYTI